MVRKESEGKGEERKKKDEEKGEEKKRGERKVLYSTFMYDESQEQALFHHILVWANICMGFIVNLAILS